MKNLKTNLIAFLVVSFFVVSCQKEDELQVIEKKQAGNHKYQSLVDNYGLEGINLIRIDDNVYNINSLGQNEYQEIENAFNSYSVVLFDDDNKEVSVMSKPMSNLEVDAFINQKKEAAMQKASSLKAVVARKVWYDVKMYEQKDYGGMQYRKYGTKNIKRSQTEYVTINNVGGAFNDKMSSFKFFVEPYDSQKCAVFAALFLYQDHFRGKFMSDVQGETVYGVKKKAEYSYIEGSVANMKQFDRQKKTFSFKWYTHYTTVSQNDKLTSFSIKLQRTL